MSIECRIIVTIESPWDKDEIEVPLHRFMAEHHYRDITLTAGGRENQLIYEELLAAGNLSPEEILNLADRKGE